MPSLSHTVIDLKRDQLTHQHLGQMQMDVNYFERRTICWSPDKEMSNSDNGPGCLLPDGSAGAEGESRGGHKTARFLIT